MNNSVLARKGEKIADICLDCLPKMEQFIQDEHQWKIENTVKEAGKIFNQRDIDIEIAKKLLKENGYTIIRRKDKQ
jgi:hypothetical protein